MFLPPASRTTRSGRTGPSGVATVTCSSKSQRAVIPASSTTRRSWSSPQRPRASGRRSAVTRACVCVRSCSELRCTKWTCSASAACDWALALSDSLSCSSTRARVSRSGSTRCSIAARRTSSSPAAVALAAWSRPSATSRKRAVLASSTCADSAWKRSASWLSTSFDLSSADRARSSADAAAAASRPRANRYPIAAPMTIPSSSPTSSKTAPICSDDLTVGGEGGADTPGRTPFITNGAGPRPASLRHNGAMTQPSDPASGSAAALLAGYLRAAGVRHVFGYPGESVIDVMEAVTRQGIAMVSAVREGTAAFMAEAAAMTGGGLGVCLSTLGPGSTALLNGVAAATLDRVPVLAVSGQIESSREQFFTHQVVDHGRMFAPVSKLALRLDPASADTVIRKALRTAVAERPGAVHLTVTADAWPVAAQGQVSLPPLAPAAASVDVHCADHRDGDPARTLMA